MAAGVWDALEVAREASEAAGRVGAARDRRPRGAVERTGKGAGLCERVDAARAGGVGVAFWNGVKGSPDGTCLLTSGDDARLRVFELGRLARPALECHGGDCVYDYAWYPRMDSGLPATCCFASSSRGRPVHLWDAYTGGLRATYSPINDKDELAATLSVAFDASGAHLYAGADRGFFRFDVGRPGAHIEFRATCPSRKSREGQRGLLSCLAANPDGHGMLAAGSYNGTVGLYVDNDPSARLALFPAHDKGVTQVRFSNCGTYLFSGGRKDCHVKSWDTRRLDQPVLLFPRQAATNQRLHLDQDASGRYLATGSSCGRALIYDLSAPAAGGTASPVAQTPSLGSTVSGVSFCRHLREDRPVLAVASGEWRAPVVDYGSDSSPDASSDQDCCGSAMAEEAVAEADRELVKDEGQLALYHVPVLSTR